MSKAYVLEVCFCVLQSAWASITSNIDEIESQLALQNSEVALAAQYLLTSGHHVRFFLEAVTAMRVQV